MTAEGDAEEGGGEGGGAQDAEREETEGDGHRGLLAVYGNRPEATRPEVTPLQGREELRDRPRRSRTEPCTWPRGERFGWRGGASPA
ncbi:hypothetical protein GCM10018987_34280 [Streptomyces cremeus]